jgi:hypothetical protein
VARDARSARRRRGGDPRQRTGAIVVGDVVTVGLQAIDRVTGRGRSATALAGRWRTACQ